MCSLGADLIHITKICATGEVLVSIQYKLWQATKLVTIECLLGIKYISLTDNTALHIYIAQSLLEAHWM